MRLYWIALCVLVEDENRTEMGKIHTQGAAKIHKLVCLQNLRVFIAAKIYHNSRTSFTHQTTGLEENTYQNCYSSFRRPGVKAN